MDPLILFLVVITITILLIWHTTTITGPSTATIEPSNSTRLLAYTINKPIIGENLRVYRPGNYTLGTAQKELLRVPTTPILQLEQKEQFDSRGVQMEFEFEDEVWLVRDNPGDLPINNRNADDILDWSAKQAYLIYGNPFYKKKDKDGIEEDRNRWVDAVNRSVRLELETIGRMFTPEELVKPEDAKPKLVLVGHIIKGVVSQGEDDPLLPPGGRFVPITTDEQLFDRIADHLVAEVNRQHRSQHGLELRPTKMAIHNVEYQAAVMRETTDRLQKARLLLEIINELVKNDPTTTRQEAMLIALGQDAEYAELVINTGWQAALAQMISETAGKVTAEALARFLARFGRAKKKTKKKTRSNP